MVGQYVAPDQARVERSKDPSKACHVRYMNTLNQPPPLEFDLNSSLLPYPNEHEWHHSLCERFCACGSDCFLAWCCPCFAMAHISAKLEAMDEVFFSFNFLVFTCCLVLVLLDCISGGNFVLKMFLIFICGLLRNHVRGVLKIPGSNCGDCCISCWCMPCVLTQIMGTLWTLPNKHPGCSFSNDSAYIV